MSPQPCPCGAPEFQSCCGPYLRAEKLPPTAEALMRSRYTAFVRGDAEHLWRTWHPQTRPASAAVDDVPWTELEVLEVQDGGPDQSDGVVEFIARYREPDGTPGALVDGRAAPAGKGSTRS